MISGMLLVGIEIVVFGHYNMEGYGNLRNFGTAFYMSAYYSQNRE
jgi:hypothetical protein